MKDSGVSFPGNKILAKCGRQNEMLSCDLSASFLYMATSNINISRKHVISC